MRTTRTEPHHAPVKRPHWLRLQRRGRVSQPTLPWFPPRNRTLLLLQLLAAIGTCIQLLSLNVPRVYAHGIG